MTEKTPVELVGEAIDALHNIICRKALEKEAGAVCQRAVAELEVRAPLGWCETCLQNVE